MANNSLAVHATPTRDSRHPFPPSSHPSPAPSVRQQTSSIAASFSNLPSAAPAVQVSPQTITVDGVLKQFSSAPDPKAAALDQVVSDRNVLSAQNTQLWKLIEKQRTGYNQILKELERIRGERDSYKSRLAAINGTVANGALEKRHKTTSERGSRPSLDTIASYTSNSSVATTYTRQPAIRHHSDENHTPKAFNHQLQSSRSFDPSLNDNEFQSNSMVTPVRTSSPPPAPPSSAPSSLSPSSASSRQSRPSPAPLVVPTRADTLPASFTPSHSPESSRNPNSGDLNTTTNNLAGTGTGVYTTTSTRPLAPHPRKSSLAESVSSIVTSGSSFGSLSSPATSNPASLSNHNFGANLSAAPSQPQYRQTGFTPPPPQTAPPIINTPPVADGLLPRQKALNPSFSNIQPLTIATPATAIPLPLSHPQPHPQTLAPMADNRPGFLSRDSRISLPDEARQYIVNNMADSPAASPRTDGFSPRSKLATSVFPPPVNGTNGRESEFLDMGEEEEEDSDEEEEGEEAGDTTAGAGDSAFDGLKAGTRPPPSSQGNNTGDHSGQHSPQLENPNNNYSSQSNNSSREDVDAKKQQQAKSRVGPEEFPLPPPSNILLQRQQALAAQQEAQLLYGQNSSQQQSPQSVQQPTSVPLPKHVQAMTDQHHHGSSSGGQYSSLDSLVPMQDGSYPGQQPPAYRSDPNFQLQHEKQDSVVQAVPPSFRALPLLSSDLPHTTIVVSHSFVRPNDRGKEVLSFIVSVNPGNGKEGWKVEKMYSDVLSLDQRVRNSVGKGVVKKIANLPEGKLWKDHAPAKVDQRKAVLENYLQTLIQLPVKNNDEVIAFFTSDIVREQKLPVMQAGHKEGYLTKRGKNFGGWKTRFFVLQGPVLEYYDCRGGAHLGSIAITGAQIARQHRTEKPPNTDDEKEYRHAFLIVEAKKGPGGNHPRHVLCAESDEDRDSWVEMLVRYYTGTYSDDLVFNPSSGLTSVLSNSVAAASQQSVAGMGMGMGQPRSSTSSAEMSTASSTPRAKPSSRDISKGSAIPISLLPPDASNGKLFQPVPTSEDYMRSGSPSRSVDPSPIDRQGPSAAAAAGFDGQKRMMERNLGLPSSLPDSSPLSAVPPFQTDGATPGQRANSELGHYSDMQQDGRAGPGASGKNQRQHSPEQHRTRDDGRKSFYPTLNTVAPSPTTAVSAPPDRVPSPEKLDASGKVKISGPMNGAPIPSGFKFGGKEPAPADPVAAANDRREKAKSRSFWGFGKANGDKSHLHAAYPPRAVFGVPLEEALDVAQMCNLPAIVFRSIQYLEAKKADQEEGIYRLSGSSAVIKNLKDMFNNEGDVDLLASDEYWDPHAIAGLLKSFLRELPSSILTRDLHLKFLAVIDFVDPQERIKELSQLIAALPLANYSLLRALTAHLILIVQNSNVNKMTMRNVGIVFSPTLGIPAGVFSLMLGEFNRVFNVGAEGDGSGTEDGTQENPSELRRNSRQYSDAAADQLLGLSGRSLSSTSAAEETPSDGDDFSIQDESGTETTEGEITVESSPSSSPAQKDYGIRVREPDTPKTPTAKSSKASNAAASRGLNVAVTHSERGNRHSRMIGLPSSPRPTTHSPSRPDMSSNSSPTPPARVE
ncbi:hypothetical protein GALMADRAFT_257428 [Galerina marginata CBS 339.88]|uniref:RhoGAP-domain-containing protein n=1 Tax=Galerina marginata (strain CBS 339.88) TaxID=685588 RepID=A0A067SDB2_GALM3|nr:hypothetical protein GALMADRAFT_257428 [Galerina marginata CBS 339.88]